MTKLTKLDYFRAAMDELVEVFKAEAAAGSAEMVQLLDEYTAVHRDVPRTTRPWFVTPGNEPGTVQYWAKAAGRVVTMTTAEFFATVPVDLDTLAEAVYLRSPRRFRPVLPKSAARVARRYAHTPRSFAKWRAAQEGAVD